MRKELLEFMQKFHVAERSMEMFCQNFEEYRKSNPQEFEKNFKSYDPNNLDASIGTVSFHLRDFPECDGEYIAIDISMFYNGKEVGYYQAHFDKEGNCEDDYFVIY